ncbi:hypothetical protein [Sneathiella limimaris]|uniref:hypothetical protein n=1 Tax=Sneathiella limimaris TaxID=1964213 RepID=UPI00146D44BD|nr:hypothetical protein [Sneathiella limimaris]
MLLYTIIPLAALATAGATLLLLLIAALLVYLLHKLQAKEAQREAPDPEKLAAMVAFVTAELEASVGDNPKTALLVAALTGLLAGQYLK